MSHGALALIGPIEPGLVARGFAENVLVRASEIDDPEALWNDATTLAGLAQKWNGHGQEKAEIKSAQMFCEILVGHLLGPNPGGGGDRRSDEFQLASYSNPHTDLNEVIPPQRLVELHRFYKHRDALLEEVRNGKRSRRSLLLLVDQWEAKKPDEIGALDIRYGDFREVLDDIEPGTVTLVLTDPPYPTEYLPLWGALGEWSSDMLINGGSLVAYCGQSILPDALRRLEGHLRYWWTIALIHGQSQMLPGKWVSIGWKPLLWFVRDGRVTQTMLADTVSGGTARKTVPTGDDGSWAQGVEALEPIISALSGPGDLIVDPFAGSGTVGLAALRFNRRFIGAELNG